MKIPEELERAVNCYRNGEQETFDRIYSLSHKHLHDYIVNMVENEDEAKDILQETYMKISRSIWQLRNTENFLNWAMVIARRKCYAHFQKSDKFVWDTQGKNWQEILNSTEDKKVLPPESVMQEMVRKRFIWEIIEGLSDMQRICMIRFYYNGQKQEEIAEELGIPLNTVKSHLNRARAKIRKEGKNIGDADMLGWK